MVLAPKGPDKTLANMGRKATRWPPGPFFDKRPDANGQLLIRLEPPLKKTDDFPKMREHFDRALEHCFRQGDWTVYIDELVVMCDPRGDMRLGGKIHRLMVAGRSRNTTVMSAAQMGTNVPRSAYQQSQHFLLWRQRDRDALRRVSDISGDTDLIRAEMGKLGYHEFLYVNAVKDTVYRVAAD
jgi:hypothetical protein